MDLMISILTNQSFGLKNIQTEPLMRYVHGINDHKSTKIYLVTIGHKYKRNVQNATEIFKSVRDLFLIP